MDMVDFCGVNFEGVVFEIVMLICGVDFLFCIGLED